MKNAPGRDDPRRYDDIIRLPRPVSALHPPMSRRERAAQFAPYAALTGLGAAINETARLTEARVEPDEGLRSALDEALRVLRDRIREQPEISATCFRPDETKPGGAYVTVTGRAKKLDETARTLTLSDGRRLAWEDILILDIIDDNYIM